MGGAKPLGMMWNKIWREQRAKGGCWKIAAHWGVGVEGSRARIDTKDSGRSSQRANKGWTHEIHEK